MGRFLVGATSEWHLHAWDLGLAIGERYQPADPNALVDAFRTFWPEFEVRRGAWESVLRLTGRSPV